MVKKKSPINASLAEIIAIGNRAFDEAALKAREAGHVVTYSDRTAEISEYVKAAQAHKEKSARNKKATADMEPELVEDQT